IVARFDLSVNLKRANSLLALRHQVDHLKPRRERVIGVLENSFRDNAESVAVALAAINVLANPMERARFQFVYALALAAAWAAHAVRPAHIAQQSFARDLVAKLLHQFSQRDRWLGCQRFASFNFLVHAPNIHISSAGVKPDIIPFA